MTVSAIESICLNKDAVGTKPSSVIPKRSTSGDVEASEMFRTYASSRVLSTTIQTSAIAYLPTQADRSRSQRPHAVRNAGSERGVGRGRRRAPHENPQRDGRAFAEQPGEEM